MLFWSIEALLYAAFTLVWFISPKNPDTATGHYTVLNYMQQNTNIWFFNTITLLLTLLLFIVLIIKKNKPTLS